MSKRKPRQESGTAHDLTEPPNKYRDWLRFFFGREVIDPYSLDWSWQGTPDETCQLAAHTLKVSGLDLQKFSNERVATGLQAILMDGLSNTAWDILSAHEDKKRELIAAFEPFYRDFLAVRAPQVLGHRSETSDNPLHYVSYMLWDVTVLDGLISIKNRESDESLLIEVLGKTLCSEYRHSAVVESILHGFGHFVGTHPKYRLQIVEAIDRYLNNRPIVREELRIYANSARTGCVL